MLGTGGAAALWSRTTNPRGAVGAGLYLALEAGAALADLELMQFHPTALRLDGELDGFLVTEAVRGEGAVLVDAAGERFVDELAPRDAVARAIDARLRAGGEVFLDMRGIDSAALPEHLERLAHAGLDPRRDLIPVAPAAHYMIGGVVTDEHGRSTLARPVCRGRMRLHRRARSKPPGLELAVGVLRVRPAGGGGVAGRAVGGPARIAAARHRRPRPSPRPRATPCGRAPGRCAKPRASRRLSADPHPLARAIALSALQRRESRGCHLRADFPDRDLALDSRHWAVSRSAEGWEAWN